MRTDVENNRIQNSALAAQVSRLVLFALLLGFGVAVGMFIQFANSVSRYSDFQEGVSADAIVVLTGDAARIDKAIDLLRAEKGERLLITGVNEKTSRGVLRAMNPGANKSFDCCVDIDREAMDTIGNARQARLWAERYGYRSLLLVTSDYHLPRSILEFRREMSNIALVPVPANVENNARSLVSDSNTFRRVAPEFIKFVAARMRLGSRPAPFATTLASGPAG